MERALETLIEEKRDGVLLIRLNRPRRRNALSMQLLLELGGLLERAEADEEVRALVITGNEQAFSAGQDLKEEEPQNYVATINAVCRQIEAFPKPTIAAISGWCIAGGLELALCCDFRVCTPDAKIGDWHAKINSIGGAGATVRLVRLLGITKAKELVFTGAAVDGAVAAAVGLVSRVLPEQEVVDGAVSFAKSLCVGSPATVQYAKRSLNAAADLSLTEAIDFSLLCQTLVRNSNDASFTAQFAAREGNSDTSA